MKSTSRDFPGFSHLYSLDDPFLNRALRATADLKGDLEIALTRGEFRPENPLVFTHAMGGKVPSDLIWTDWVVITIFADRVVEILRREGFKGWSTYPVEIRGKDGQVFPGYHGMSFSGRCGPLDDARSTIVHQQMPGGLIPHYKGMYFDPDTWDGSDLFLPANYGGVLVTEAVKKAFDKAKVKNVRFSRLDEIMRMVPSI